MVSVIEIGEFAGLICGAGRHRHEVGAILSFATLDGCSRSVDICRAAAARLIVEERKRGRSVRHKKQEPAHA